MKLTNDELEMIALILRTYKYDMQCRVGKLPIGLARNKILSGIPVIEKLAGRVESLTDQGICDAHVASHETNENLEQS